MAKKNVMNSQEFGMKTKHQVMIEFRTQTMLSFSTKTS